jgi:NAD-reducing hydrogenase large subunit
MAQTITIDTVTRIEGHSRITIQLNNAGEVEDAHFHVTQFRGFEKFCEGRPFREMPALTARTCGICPVSHLIASAKACDELLAVRIPETAVKLRKILNLAQLVQSHALSFFHLSSPDLLLGMDADPAKRNIFGVLEKEPDLARGGIRLRQFGQQIIERLGGKRVHPAWVVPGGVNKPLVPEIREQILSEIPDALGIIQRTLAIFKPMIDQYQDEIRTFANFPTMYMGLVTPEGELEHYDGLLRMIDQDGNIVQDHIAPYHYQDFIGEAVEPWSYLKSPYYIPMGYPDGIYRVGPTARLLIAQRCGTPLADQELEIYRQRDVSERHSGFHNHYARLIEILYGIEKIEQLLNEPDILNQRVQSLANPNSPEGVGISEAPRGTLIHHYRINDHGLIEWVNMIIATGHNNLAMNKGVLQVAKHYVKGEKIAEGMLNRVEAVIRTFDPCLSCSTHAMGQMPLSIELMNVDGEIVNQVKR